MQRDSHQPTSIQHRYGGTARMSEYRENRTGPPTGHSPSRCLRPLPGVQVVLLSTTHTQTTSLMPSPTLGEGTETQNIRNNRALRDDRVALPFSQMCTFPHDLLNRGLSIKHGGWDALENRELASSSQSLAKQLKNPVQVLLPQMSTHCH